MLKDEAKHSSLLDTKSQGLEDLDAERKGFPEPEPKPTLEIPKEEHPHNTYDDEYEDEDEKYRQYLAQRRAEKREYAKAHPEEIMEKIKNLTDEQLQDHYDVSSDYYKDENGVRPHGFLPAVAWDYLVQNYGLEPNTEAYRIAKERYKKWWNDSGYDIDEWNNVTKRT